MLENEKRKYPVYRKQGEGCVYLCEARMALYMTSDRRDEDKDGLCVYLKKTYRAICDRCAIKEGDTVLNGNERLLVISVGGVGAELCLHLEGVEIIDTSRLEITEARGESSDV